MPGEIAGLGESYDLVLSGMPVSLGSAPIGILGLSKTNWGDIPLPLDASIACLTGCTLYVSLRNTYALSNVGGSASWSINIPSSPNPIALPIYMQGIVVDMGANPANLILSNAGEAMIVGR